MSQYGTSVSPSYGAYSPSAGAIQARQLISDSIRITGPNGESELTFSIDSATELQTGGSEVVVTVSNTLVSGEGFTPTVDVTVGVAGESQTQTDIQLFPGDSDTLTFSFGTTGTVEALMERQFATDWILLNAQTDPDGGSAPGGGFSRDQLLLLAAVILVIAAVAMRR